MEKVIKYWAVLMLTLLLLLSYPIYMGFSVIRDMAVNGYVWQADYPKYVIPYTPIAISVLLSAALMPWLLRKSESRATLWASLLGVGIFLLAELVFEEKIIVANTVCSTTLESWQLAMCYIPPGIYETRTWTAVDVLMGEYSPTFKLHFYMISLVLVLSLVNVIYGWGRMRLTGDRTRARVLTLQGLSTTTFLGLCILACFTAFFRDGELTVSPLSAGLMTAFFLLLGITGGLWLQSFLLGRGRAPWLPGAFAAVLVLGMYLGELCLLSGHLYRFGSGFLFDGLPGIVLAPVDIVTILSAGGITWLLGRKL